MHSSRVSLLSKDHKNEGSTSYRRLFYRQKNNGLHYMVWGYKKEFEHLSISYAKFEISYVDLWNATTNT